MRLVLLIALLVLPLAGFLLPPGRPNLTALADGPQFPNGVVACGSTFCDADGCQEMRGENGKKEYQCRAGRSDLP